MTIATLGMWPAISPLATRNRTEPVAPASTTRTWRQGHKLLGITRAYADLFALLQTDGFLPSFRNGERILDCGIGTVAFSLVLTNVRVMLDGIDIIPRVHLPGSGMSLPAGVHVSTHHGNVRQLPFAAETFDMVLTTYHQAYREDPQHELQDMLRVLRPGASFLMIIPRRDRVHTLPALTSHSETPGLNQFMHCLHEVGLDNMRQYDLSSHYPLNHWIEAVCIGVKPEHDDTAS